MALNIEELDGSELGTKDYWDDNYKHEIKNYKKNGDVGEIWFNEDSQIRIINWILKSNTLQFNDRIIDIGCGNGMMLIELAREGFNNLIGIDYSSNAIQLAKEIAKDQNLSIEYKVVDILIKPEQENLGIFDAVHDKGTYDAISLNPDQPAEKRKMYINNVKNILKPSGFLVLTSCNWTEEELEASFKPFFKKFHVIPTPNFKFGGKIGNIITSIVFKRDLNDENNG